jgi:threonine dehydratase
VCSAHAPASARSFAARRVVEAPVSTKLGDGMACRKLDADAIATMVENVDHIVEVTDAELADAMRAIFRMTHNVAEGSGAAGFAAAWRERESLAGKRVGLSMTGGNVDAPVFADVLAGKY